MVDSAHRISNVLPLLEGRGRGWVGFRIFDRLRLKLADPPPTPPFQGGETAGDLGFARAFSLSS